MLELCEAALDMIAQSVDVAVDGRLDFAVLARRDDGLCAPFREVFTNGIAVVAFVGDENLGLGAGFVHYRLIAHVAGNLAARQRDRDGKPDRVGSQMDLGRVATARAPDILVSSPLFAAEAC